MYNKDTLNAVSDGTPWLSLSPRCVLFDTSAAHGNFFHQQYVSGGEITSREINGRWYVWVLKTQALRHFDVKAHYLWSDEGYGGANLESLIMQEYREEYDQRIREGELPHVVCQDLVKSLLKDTSLVARFPVAQTVAIERPDPKKHMAVLACKKGRPITDITVAHLDLYNPIYDTSVIVPGASAMLSSLRGNK